MARAGVDAVERTVEVTANPLLRLRAVTVDLLVVAGWAAFAGVAGGVLRWAGVRFETAFAWDLFSFSTLVLPVVVTFAWQEASSRHATFGKHRIGLRVVLADGTRLAFGRSFLRSGAKFLPWQLAHTAVFHMVVAPSVGYLVLSVIAQALVVVSLLAVVLDPGRRALHDWVAGTQVVVAARQWSEP